MDKKWLFILVQSLHVWIQSLAEHEQYGWLLLNEGKMIGSSNSGYCSFH